MPPLIHLPNAQVMGELTPAGIRAGADSGTPSLKTHAAPKLDDAEAGIWECQPGGWPVVDRPTTETCYVLSGRATLTDAGTGATTVITTGDFVVLPRGWSGRWDVEETLRKVYVIF